MGPLLRSFALFFACLDALVSAEPKAQIIFAENDALLKLDYATYRGYYNSTNEVIGNVSLCNIQISYRVLGVYIQEYSLCCDSCG
jgi:hypothetical protein